MSSSGWVKIHRQIWLNPVVSKDSDHIAVWLWLLTHAAHQDHDTLYGGKRFTLHAGQLIIGRKKLAGELHINEHKIDRIIKTLKNEQQIEHYGKPYGSLITICNWHKYQVCEQQIKQPVSNQRATSEQPVSTIQELKNNKNDKETYIQGQMGDSIRDIIRRRVGLNE